MKTYCITPVHNPNIDYLKQNIESIRSQTKEVKHMLVFDGQGLDQRKIRDRVDLSEIEIMQLPESHGDYGDIPRFLGSVSAFRRGAEAGGQVRSQCLQIAYRGMHVRQYELALPVAARSLFDHL